MRKIPVGVLGATGIVGQHYVSLLANHPWFELRFLAASDQSAGKSYPEAVKGRFRMAGSPVDLPVHSLEAIEKAKAECRFVFSAMTTEGAALYEERYAKSGLPVVSNASYHRSTPHVPMIIPEVNPEHLSIISQQFIVTKPNCSIQSYMIPLFPLHRLFGVKKLHVTTLQALSGAGYPGVSSLDMVDNVIPYIAEEEEKSEQEPLKIFGRVEGGLIVPAEGITIAAHCNRVPVLDGHMACVSVEFERKPTREEILRHWEAFQPLNLPSSPEKLIVYCEEENRPQPRLDRNQGNGMAVTVGRLRPCPLFHYRFVALSHNAIRGAAGGGILNAELLVSKKYLE